jgi:subtilisin-like proprotein convertase family protein
MNALSLNRPLSSRPLPSASFLGEATRPNSAASTRAAERSGAQRELPRMDSSMLTRLGSSFAPAAARAIPGVASAGDTEKTVRAAATPNAPIADNSKVESTLHVDDELSLKGGSINVDIPHTYRGDLVVTLTSPSGKSVKLHDRAGGSLDDLKAKFDLSAFAGESTKGDWKLTVEDTAQADVGTLKAWDLELTGTAKGEEPPPPNPEDPFQGLRDAALLAAIKKSSTGKHVVSYNEARKIIFTDLDVKNGKVKDVYTGREINGGKIPSSSDMNVQWSQGGSKFGLDAAGRKVFEPADEHKGNVARALFYFSAEYNKRIAPEEEAVLREWNKLDKVDASEIARDQKISTIQGNHNQFVAHSDLADRIADF